MSPADGIALGLKKSFQFSGRATRSEFWWFAAFTVLMGLVAAGIDWSFFTAKGYLSADYKLTMLRTNHEAARLVSILILVPVIAICMRRLIDAKHSVLWVVPAALAALFVIVMVWTGTFTSGRGVIDLRQSQSGTIPATLLGFFLGFIAPLLPFIFPLWLYLKPSKQAEVHSANPNEVPS